MPSKAKTGVARRTISKLTPKDRDWLEIYGNQYRPAKVMPGTCEACVFGLGRHANSCINLQVAVDVAKAAIGCNTALFGEHPSLARRFLAEFRP